MCPDDAERLLASRLTIEGRTGEAAPVCTVHRETIMPTRLEKLQTQQAQLKAQIQQVLAAERTVEKKKETRRKFLIGDAVLAQVRSGELTGFDLSSVMDRFLAYPNDRALFGLEPLPIDTIDREMVDQESGDIEVDINKQKNGLVADPSNPPNTSPTANTKARAKKGSAAKKKR